MEIAGLCNIHPDDAEASLRFLLYFYYHKPPGFKASWNQLREQLEEEENNIYKLRKMYLAALEEMATVIDEYGYLPEKADIAMDLTNIMWYGRHSTEKDEKGKRLNRDETPHADQPLGVEGVNQKSGTSFAFQIASVSLANVEIPVTWGEEHPSTGRQRAPDDELLTYAKHYVEPDIACMDGGFYGRGMHDCLGLKFISRLQGRTLAIINDLKETVIFYDMDYNTTGYDVHLSEVVPESQVESWLITMLSEKRISKTETGIKDKGNWDCTTRTSIRRSSVG